MEIYHGQYIGKEKSAKGSERFRGIDPTTNDSLDISFYEATGEEIDKAIQKAENAFQEYSTTSNQHRASFLERIADEILALGDALIQRCMSETALPEGRLTGERGRTMGQLKLFASVVREGSWVDARIDMAQPDRKPFPKADIRHQMIPLGPVAIFGASNFPLAFSVAGGDTASALASGCPVVVKGHPAHPGTSSLIASAIDKAALATGMPNGVFSMVQGVSHEVGSQLVQHPLITAVGFTGSHKGGKALFDLASQREVPIPVYAEMGSTNPVFILPGALAEKGADIAAGLAGSITLGVGQFCTNPGLVFITDKADVFKQELQNKIEESTAGTMLTNTIKSSYVNANEALQKAGINLMGTGKSASTTSAVPAQVYAIDTSTFESQPELSEEIFGPSSIIIEGNDKASFISAAKNLSGHLTATIHGTAEDLSEYKELFDILKRKVGRLLINGYPTGVEVCPSMVHGGPYPATTAPQTTSVGTNAIKRFARPLCYQNFPQELLPSGLQDANPDNIWRMIDGEMTKESLT